MQLKSTESQQGKPSARKLNLKILLAIAGIALAVKLVIFFLSVKTSMGFSLPNAENWQDFSLAYVPAVNAFKSGFLPYVNFYYPYPPLFLYALTIFSYLPFPSWSSAIPLVLADALTVIPVYLIAREFVSERYSLIISLLFIIAPSGLYYIDYLWLNPSLTTLFLLVSIYFLLKRHSDLSALTLAISIGFKQTALFALPIIAVILWKRGREGAAGEQKRANGDLLRFLFLTGSICFLFSLPYVILSPTLYLESVARIPLYLCGSSSVNLPQNYCNIAVGTGSPISIDLLNHVTSKWALVAQGVNNPVTLSLPIFIFFVPSSLAWFYQSTISIQIWILLASYLFLIYCCIRRKKGNDQSQGFSIDGSLRFILFGLLLVLVFYPFYKYYVVGIIPVLVLLVRNKKDALGFVLFNFVLFFIPRYLSSWLLLIALLWLLRAHAAKSRIGRRLLSYAVLGSTVFLISFAPFAATSSVVYPVPLISMPVCSSSGPVIITSNSSFSESCVLLPGSSVNESSNIQIPGGGHASFAASSNSGLPFDVAIRDNTNGSFLFSRQNVTNGSTTINLSFGSNYSLIIKNDSSQNNTITISSQIESG